MGIIVGYFAALFAAGAFAAAWPLGWFVGGYRRAALILAAGLGLLGFAIAWVEPIDSTRPETAIWPFSAGGGGVIVFGLLLYHSVFAAVWRWVKRLAGS